MYSKTTVNECPHCDYVSESHFPICPICSSESAGWPSGGTLFGTDGTVRDGRMGRTFQEKPICQTSDITVESTDFQSGFRFAMQLMERVGHRLDTKELFDTLTDVAIGDLTLPRSDNHVAEASQAFALRMLRVIDEECRTREALRRPKPLADHVGEKVAAYS